MKQFSATEIFKGLSMFLLLLLGLWFAYQIKGVIISIFIAFILNAAIRPLINYLEKIGINRTLAILLTYLVGFVITAIIIFAVVNISVNQAKLFFSNIDSKLLAAENFVDSYVPFLRDFIDFDVIKSSIESQSLDFSTITSSGFYTFILDGINLVSVQGISIVGGIIGGLLSVFVVIMVSVYMLLNRKSAYEGVIELLPPKYEKRLLPVLRKMEASLGSWLMGQGILMLIIGVATYFIMILPLIFDSSYPVAQYALIVAVLAGILEAVPNLGPALTMIVTILIALISGAGIGIVIYVAVAFLLLQQLEGVVLVPAVMKRAIDLNPIISIAAVLAGFQLGGPIAALIAIPIAAIAQIALLEISGEVKKKDK
jgi:predicted PurR-regulated permease PerM